MIACNFCPFAAREIKRGSIHYTVLEKASNKTALEALATVFLQMDEEAGIETSLVILPGSFTNFNAYLQLAELAESLLEKEGYKGIYQLASFTPNMYLPAPLPSIPPNYTNRSPYPMLHILRKASVSKPFKW